MNLVITGTSTGIGRALAARLLAQGHAVWGLARSAQGAPGAGAFRATRCDVADWTQMERAAAEIAVVWPHADGLVTCAGTQGAVGPAVTLDPTAWSATVRTNLDGTYYAIRALHPLLRRAPRRGKIVCFSGGGASKARPNFSAYGVAKTGVVRLVETLAEEVRAEPLDINAVAPGAINTRMTEEVLRLGPAVVGEVEYQAARRPAARSEEALQKALGLVEWLLSPASDGISGRFLAASWDPWATLGEKRDVLMPSDVYTLRRVVPEDRGLRF
ncbi:MAG TPA: SDR family oxidoreductase [Opitutaceae bacterium]|nr:SDR family oxidoreductase [Opitutaceae bacterium]